VTANGGFLQASGPRVSSSSEQHPQYFGDSVYAGYGPAWSPSRSVTCGRCECHCQRGIAAADGDSPYQRLTLANNNNQLQLGAVSSGLLASQTTDQIYGGGPPLPSTINMQNYLQPRSQFNTTRVTEGFAKRLFSLRVRSRSDQGARHHESSTRTYRRQFKLVVPD